MPDNEKRNNDKLMRNAQALIGTLELLAEGFIEEIAQPLRELTFYPGEEQKVREWLRTHMDDLTVKYIPENQRGTFKPEFDTHFIKKTNRAVVVPTNLAAITLVYAINETYRRDDDSDEITKVFLN